MKYTEVSYDLVVAGGGVGGVIAAITASRKGLRVALVDNKCGLGGNACSEIGVSIDGAVCFGLFPGMREGGPVEELKEQLVALDPFFRNTQGSTVMLFWCEAEKVTVYSELNLHTVDTDGRKVTAVYGSQGGTERNYKFVASQFVDATGDGTIAALAGCAFRTGREAKSEFGELLAPETADQGIMGASVLFRASEKKEPTSFQRPTWAYEYTREDDLPHRLAMQKGPVDHGFWWVEYAGDNNDPIADYENIRKELLKCTYGVWAFLKSDPSRGMEYYSLDNVSISPAKRESRRIVGDYTVCERDIVERTPFPDAVAYAGWNIDIHVPGGFKSRLKPNVHAHFPWVFTVPLRSLYARDMDNLWLVGRDISVSHVALGATRLQATIGTMGHAVGIAAALAHRHSQTAQETARERYSAVQQEILKDGSFIPGVKNNDPNDHALSAAVCATSEQSLAFQRSGEYLPAGKGLALSFPVTESRVERVLLPLRNFGQTPVEVTLHFAPSAHPNDFSHRKALAQKTILLEPGAHDISWEPALPSLEPGLYAVLILTEGEVGWLQSAVEPGGCYTAKYDPSHYLNLTPETKEDLYTARKPIMVGTGYLPVEWVRPNRHRFLQLGRPPGRGNIPLPFVEILPAQRPYAPVNVVSGVSHSNILPDLWISNPAIPLPQEIQLTWQQVQTISSVRIVFDTDADMNHPAVRPIDHLVKRYTLAVKKEGAWEIVATCADNRQRFKIHTFEPCVAEALKLVVEAVHDGGKSARVFEIRAY